MHRLPARRPVLAAAAALVVAACGEAAITDPALRSFQGTFALRTVDGSPPPVLRASGSVVRYYLLADTITFDGRGRYSRVTVTRMDSVGRGYGATSRPQSDPSLTPV